MRVYKIFFILLILFVNGAFAAMDTAPLSETNIILPEHLKPGDTVGLLSSGFRASDEDGIQYASERLKALGLNVKYGKSILKHDAYFAGTDKERAADLNEMFADSKVKAIFEVRGGWGSNRILPYLNYELIKNNPKILIGFSDITSLLLAIHSKTNLVTFHGPMGIEAWPQFTVNYLKRILFAGEKVVLANPKTFDSQVDIIQTDYRIRTITGGVAKGKLIGGNLTVIVSMLGSEYLPNWKGAILFIEDVDEDYYQIDRMMEQLKMAGVLDKISGFIFGQCKRCSAGGSGSTSSTIGSLTLTQILNHYIKPLRIPAWSGAMIGHESQMFTLPEGISVQIDADKGTISMLRSAVR